MRRPSFRCWFVLALALSAAPLAQADAQSSAAASISVTATVLSPISIVTGQPLGFGKVGQGTNKSVAPDDPSSGRFTIQGQGNAAIAVTLTLPATLSDGATHTLAITGWTGKFGDGSDASGGSAFTPTTGVTGNYLLPGVSTSAAEIKYFRLGASVQPLANQTPGAYSGAISVNTTYTEI